MTDVLTKKQRSFNMSSIRAKNTKPELIVRSVLSKLGFRYRLHKKLLPGNPDIVFLKHKKVIFVNGCYWHMHKCKYGKVIPKTNSRFWKDKRLSNKKRDKINYAALKKIGWKKLIVWECETKKEEFLNRIIHKCIAPLS